MKIAILDDYADCALEMADWARLGAEITVFRAPLGAAAAQALAGFEVVCLMRERTPFPAELIAALPALRLIVTTGARNLSIDVAAARARGVEVCGTRSRKTTTSELTLALLLALSRRLVPEARALAEGGWQGRPGATLPGCGWGSWGLAISARSWRRWGARSEWRWRRGRPISTMPGQRRRGWRGPGASRRWRRGPTC